MKNLVIVESPSKSKTIGKYLGEGYTVVSSKGHIRDLAIKGKDGLGVDVDNNFEATYQISKDKKETVKELKKLAGESDYVYLATDPDREGEAISWHLAQELGLDESQIKRNVLQLSGGQQQRVVSRSMKLQKTLSRKLSSSLVRLI